jgi:CheY-like chemotaxis protein
LGTLGGRSRPDVVLMDYRLTDGTGAETARELRTTVIDDDDGGGGGGLILGCHVAPRFCCRRPGVDQRDVSVSLVGFGEASWTPPGETVRHQ